MESMIVPGERYYYGWYSGGGRQDVPHNRPDGAIKADIVERLRHNAYTAACHLRVDVKQAVVIVQGDVPTRVAKRSAGDDCWDTLGVADVSNQLSVAGELEEVAPPQAIDVMTATPVAVPASATIVDAAVAMRTANIGDVVVIDDEGHPIGIVTDRDIVVRALARGLGVETPVGELRGATLHTVAPGALLADVVTVMTQQAVRRVPVVEDGHLVGIISLGDLARRRDPGSVLATIASTEPLLDDA